MSKNKRKVGKCIFQISSWNLVQSQGKSQEEKAVTKRAKKQTLLVKGNTQNVNKQKVSGCVFIYKLHYRH